MRTTIDFPEPVLTRLRAIARDKGTTLSAVVVELVDQRVERRRPARILRGKSGFPMLEGNGRIITTEDVRALDDEE